MLGTVVEVGVPAGHEVALEAAFAAVSAVQATMSIYEPQSDLARAHAAEPGAFVPVSAGTAQVLSLAARLQEQTEGLFDISLGSGRWCLQDDEQGPCLIRLDGATRLNLGGIAKGWAVDQAVEAAWAQGCPQVWVNAGGDLRAAGVAVPVWLRDERTGGVRPWLTLEDGAVATSDFSAGARSRLAARGRAEHVSVAAPRCVWADALTKVLAMLGRPDHPLMADLLRHYQAEAWVHGPA